MANKYDNFLVKMANFATAKQSLSNDISDLTKKIEMLNKKPVKTEEDLERLEQYGRRENLEIHGIPFTQNEKTNKVVRKVANVLKLKLEEKIFRLLTEFLMAANYPASLVSSKLVTTANIHLL